MRNGKCFCYHVLTHSPFMLGSIYSCTRRNCGVGSLSNMAYGLLGKLGTSLVA
jgi:hypothetical protein